MKYWKRKAYWEALIKWKLMQYTGYYEFQYRWWRARCRLIKQEEI